MKKFHFKPLPGLTVITLIMFSILIGLGTWQYQRLGWKTKILAEIDQAANSAPLTSLRNVVSALENEEPLDFRRIELAATFFSEKPYNVYTPRDGDFGWRLYAPMENGGLKTYAAIDVIDDGMPPKIYRRPADLAGYVRIARHGKRRTQSTPDQNRWFGFNPMPETHNWADRMEGLDVRYYLDIVPGETSAANLPVKYPEVRNNHFEYMLTWYSLAFILLIYYVLMHRKVGRLGWS